MKRMDNDNDDNTNFANVLKGALVTFCDALHIDPSQEIDKTIRQFLVISAASKDQLDTAYSKIGEDFQMIQYRSGRGLNTYVDPSTAPTYDKSFWNNIFASADVSVIDDIGIYKHFKEQMAQSLDNYLGWQKALAYYLTSMKNKHGAYIAGEIISEEVGKSIDKFNGLSEEELAQGLGLLIASMEFPRYADIKLELSTQDQQRHDSPKVRRGRPKTKASSELSLTPQKKWNTGAQRKYSATKIIKSYINLRRLKSHFPGKIAFKHILGSIAVVGNEWKTIDALSSVKNGQGKPSRILQGELKKQLFGDDVTSEKWMPFLSILDHCDLAGLIQCDEMKQFITVCQKVLPDTTFTQWSNVGTAKKFLTVYTENWNDIWTDNWKIDQGLERAIMAYRKTHKKLQKDTVKELCKL